MTSKDVVLAEFNERLERAHSHSRPLILDREFACKVRDAMKPRGP